MLRSRAQAELYSPPVEQEQQISRSCAGVPGNGVVHGTYTYNRRMIKYVTFPVVYLLEQTS